MAPRKTAARRGRTAAAKSTRASAGRPRRVVSQKQPAAPAVPAPLAPLARALAKEPAVTIEKGWGSANVAFKVRGKIFAMTMATDLVLKLPKDRVDALVDGGRGVRFDPRKDGRVMKEWLVLPLERLVDAKLVREALAGT